MPRIQQKLFPRGGVGRFGRKEETCAVDGAVGSECEEGGEMCAGRETAGSEKDWRGAVKGVERWKGGSDGGKEVEERWGCGRAVAPGFATYGNCQNR